MNLGERYVYTFEVDFNQIELTASVDYTPYVVNILVILISVSLSALVAWSLDVRKEKERDRNKKINAYRELIDAFSSNNAKDNSGVENVTRILSENHTILDDRFKELLPSTLEFDAYWCVDVKVAVVGQEGPIPNNLTFSYEKRLSDDFVSNFSLIIFTECAMLSEAFAFIAF